MVDFCVIVEKTSTNGWYDNVSVIMTTLNIIMFLLFFPEEIQKLPENALNKNTVKTTNTWMNV